MAVPDGIARMLTGILQAEPLAALEQLPGLVAEHAERAGLYRIGIYVADLRKDVLRELTGRGLDARQGGTELGVIGTLPGHAFRDVQTLSVPCDQGRERFWSPLLDGTERLGVLRVEVPAGDTTAGQAVLPLASLVGLLLVSKRSSSDSYARLVRTRPMTVTAEMQWKLMPPLTFANKEVSISAAMEPAYEIAGDALDYAVADGTAHVAIFDAMGHDTTAGLTANLAVAAYRNQRRQGADLVACGEGIERALMEQFGGIRYVTSILTELDLRTGLLSWISHGHLPPVLIRGGRSTTELPCSPAHPLGTDMGLTATVCREQLHPGDRLLLYTDGITEARDAAGREFGLDRFVDFIIRHHADGLPIPETLRRLVQALLDYHAGDLRDDATVLFLEWPGEGLPEMHFDTEIEEYWAEDF